MNKPFQLLAGAAALASVLFVGACTGDDEADRDDDMVPVAPATSLFGPAPSVSVSVSPSTSVSPSKSVSASPSTSVSVSPVASVDPEDCADTDDDCPDLPGDGR